MAATRRKRRKKSAAPKRRRRRKVRAAVAAPRRRRRKKAAKVVRRRRRRHVKVEAKRTRRRRRKAPAATPRRRRRRRVHAWKGNPAGHAKAARKGHRRRKARKTTRRHRRRRKVSEVATVAAPRRRRHKRRVHAVAARRHRRRHSVRASRGGGMNATEMIMATVSGGFGFVMADGLDRFLATYNPSGATKPTDKFTSDGTGTLANTLNIASMPGWKRAVAAVGMVAAPAGGAMFIKNPYVRASLEGMAIGAGVSGFKTLWANVIMPMLIGKDTSVPTLQNSYIARLYPAEVAAHVNAAAHKAGGSAAGMLSGQADVGPFALANVGGDSPYPDAHEALGYRTGVHGDSPYPDAAQALRHNSGVSEDSQYPSAAQALRAQTGMSAPLPTGGPPTYMPGPPPGAGPGPQTKGGGDCGCVGDEYAGFLAGAPEEETFFNTGN